MDNRKGLSAILLFSVLVISTCGLIYELIAGALASYLLGDSVKQFSFIIGIYLFSMGIGSYLSKYLKINLFDKFIDIEQLIGLVGGTSSIVLFMIFHHDAYFEFVLYTIVAITGICVGVEIPLLMTILKDRFEFQDLVSNIFTFDYIGALFASIAFPIFLIPYFGLVRTSLAFGLVNIIISFLVIYKFKEELRRPRIHYLKGLSIGLFLIILFVFSDKILKYSEEKLMGENIIFQKQTPYQRIVLTRSGRDVKLFLNNNLQFNSTDEYRYHESLVHPAMSIASKIDNILVLGGGDGMAVREVLKYKDVKQITLVELDPEMTELFKTNTILKQLNHQSLSHSKLKIINQDAFLWAKNTKEKYDVIIIDFPDPSNYSVGKLYTNYFYKFIHNLSNPEALTVIQTTSPFFAPKSFWCIHNTVASIFNHTTSYHTYLPSFGEWGYAISSDKLDVVQAPIIRKVDSLRYYDFNLKNLTYFPQDMKVNNVEINQIYNQILVRYFEEEWAKIQQ